MDTIQYTLQVTQAEGFGKETLFTILDGLEKDTRPLSDAARAALAADKGADALLPWNTGYCLAGETDKLQDPYFPFEKAPGVWAASFAALGINYQQSTMNLDLCDRQGKYSNGFCHWPIAPYTKSDGTWVPAQVGWIHHLCVQNCKGTNGNVHERRQRDIYRRLDLSR